MKGNDSRTVLLLLYLFVKNHLYSTMYFTPTFKSVMLFSYKNIREGYDSVKILAFPHLFVLDFLLGRAFSGKSKRTPSTFLNKLQEICFKLLESL